ncbi:MAG: hypothetical protein HN353_05665 [Bdellovibrionales bacterium]|jgi:hypothetical protein|nr:hypothetical protein [Bdellovibrionales bacterium]MBT3525070.1 hypothetical protein [Bdellovibrionales bacterium]MBT7669790.1 hypothetical protein [Bdellovibrionales bacterium]MBT7767409.1 hypothetical protein [Bdellovibrionales bacterium]
MTTKNSVEELERLIQDVYPQVEKDKVQQQLDRVNILNLDEVMSASNQKFEESIKEMFNTIKDLDMNLRHSIDLNIAFKREARDLHRDVATYKGEAAALNDRLRKMEHNAPTIIDLELKMKLTLEEMDRLREDHYKEREDLAAVREENGEIKLSQKQLQMKYDLLLKDSANEKRALEKELNAKVSSAEQLERKFEEANKDKNEALDELAQSKEELVDLYKAINSHE